MLLFLSSPNLLPRHIPVFRIRTIAPESGDETSHLWTEIRRVSRETYLLHWSYNLCSKISSTGHIEVVCKPCSSLIILIRNSDRHWRILLTQFSPSFIWLVDPNAPRKRRSRWGDAKTEIPGLPTAISAAGVSQAQLDNYAIHLRLEEINRKLRLNDFIPPERERYDSGALVMRIY